MRFDASLFGDLSDTLRRYPGMRHSHKVPERIFRRRRIRFQWLVFKETSCRDPWRHFAETPKMLRELRKALWGPGVADKRGKLMYNWFSPGILKFESYPKISPLHLVIRSSSIVPLHKGSSSTFVFLFFCPPNPFYCSSIAKRYNAH